MGDATRRSRDWRIEATTREEFLDPVAEGLVADAADLGIRLDMPVHFVRVFHIRSAMGRAGVERVARELIADPVSDRFSADGPLVFAGAEVHHSIEVTRKPGVMDPVEASTLLGIRDMGLEAEAVSTSRRYVFCGSVSQDALATLGDKILANNSIEIYRIDSEIDALALVAPPYRFELREVEISGLADDELLALSDRMRLSLNLAEMKTVVRHYAALKREPTDVELETLAQTWSEHCVHKTFRGLIEYDGEVIDNLLKSTIVRVTNALAKPWCVSVFVDNAGIIEFDDANDIAFTVETHNHPSAIEPYGGAGTGIGGVIRDILGVGLGGRPFANTDVFCFGPPDLAPDRVPPGSLHPKRVMKGVVSGVRDYGNRMGIPTANGAVYFDERFTGNPIVYCGTAGILPKNASRGEARAGDLIVLVGGRTGRDGIHGATFSSIELTHASATIDAGAVQIGNPITEKKVTDVLLEARDRGLFTAVTDCGAGGLSSAVGEMGEKLGAEVHLERVPLKYAGLSYTEIWISEAQERMVLAVPPAREREILGLFAGEDVEATVIGLYTGDRELRLFYEGHKVAELDMEFLHDGLPRLKRKAEWRPPSHPEPDIPESDDYGPTLKRILAHPNVASKEWVIRQYDHEVQGATMVKPLVGAEDDGPGDAAVFTPVYGSKKGVIMSVGMNPKLSDIDPYVMAAHAVDEACRQVVAVGGSLERTALLDNFSWGNTNKPDRLGGLVRAARGAADVALAYGTPFISGKDSLNNEYDTPEGTVVIPGCLLVSAISVMDDVTKAVTMDAKTAGDLVYLVGPFRPEMGASIYYELHGAVGSEAPPLDPELGRRVLDALSRTTDARSVQALHDLSEGGLAAAAAEMAFAGGLGMEIDLPGAPEARTDVLLFSEGPSRFLAEVTPSDAGAFESALGGVPFAKIGMITDSGRLVVKDGAGRAVIDEPIGELKEAWKKTLRF